MQRQKIFYLDKLEEILKILLIIDSHPVSSVSPNSIVFYLLIVPLRVKGKKTQKKTTCEWARIVTRTQQIPNTECVVSPIILALTDKEETIRFIAKHIFCFVPADVAMEPAACVHGTCMHIHVNM